MACQGRFAQRCPSGACEGSLGQSGQFGYRSLTFATPALLPAGVSGSRVPEEDPGLSSAWLLAVHVEGHGSYVSTRRPLTHTPSSFPLCCGFVWDTPCPTATPHRGLSRGREDVGVRGRWDGGQPGFSSHDCETESDSVEVDEVTLVRTSGHQVSEFGLCYLMAQ